MAIYRTPRKVIVAALIGCLHLHVAAQTPAGTAFTYQGRLSDAGSAAHGLYDFQFTLYDASSAGSPIGASVLKDDVVVNGGVFNVLVDFGAAAFNGDARWLEVAVRPGASAGAYTTIAPRHQLAPTPYALEALRFGGKPPADYALLAGAQTFTGANTFSNPANVFAGDGLGLSVAGSNIVGGIADASLSANVAMRGADNSFTGANAFSNSGNSFTGVVKLVESVGSCDAAAEGRVRFNSFLRHIEVCANFDWRPIGRQPLWGSAGGGGPVVCSTSAFTNTGITVGTSDAYNGPFLFVVDVSNTNSPSPGTITYRLVGGNSAELGRTKLTYGTGSDASKPLNWTLPVQNPIFYPVRLECMADQSGAGLPDGSGRIVVIPL
jgi:hypothetical protein